MPQRAFGEVAGSGLWDPEAPTDSLGAHSGQDVDDYKSTVIRDTCTEDLHSLSRGRYMLLSAEDFHHLAIADILRVQLVSYLALALSVSCLCSHLMSQECGALRCEQLPAVIALSYGLDHGDVSVVESSIDRIVPYVRSTVDEGTCDWDNVADMVAVLSAHCLQAPVTAALHRLCQNGLWVCFTGRSTGSEHSATLQEVGWEVLGNMGHSIVRVLAKGNRLLRSSSCSLAMPPSVGYAVEVGQECVAHCGRVCDLLPLDSISPLALQVVCECGLRKSFAVLFEMLAALPALADPEGVENLKDRLNQSSEIGTVVWLVSPRPLF